MAVFKQVTSDVINTYLSGHDPMEHIITIESTYDEDSVYVIYVDDKGVKRIKKDAFKPFLWAKASACQRMCDGNRRELQKLMREYSISVRKLITSNKEDDSPVNDRLENGYKFIFYATRKMSYTRFLSFFNKVGVPVYSRKKKKDTDKKDDEPSEYIALAPTEQYMISTGKRLFKGYENYDELHRVSFDLETQGLQPRIHRIEQIGIHDNRGFDKIIPVDVRGLSKEEADKVELCAIAQMLQIVSELKSDVLFGHNSENFDWDFLITRCDVLGYPFDELSKQFFRYPIYKRKKPATLKLGGETETYYPTIVWGTPVLDSLHAARRAQAIDSNMKKSNLKYVTKYLNLKKPNRVYVPGDDITSTWAINDPVFAFNDTDGSWYRITENKPLQEGYEAKSGRYIVERYLLDDIWETDKIELALNEANFLVAKMLPTTYARVCTMGTAGIWKLIMLGWAYENNLAVPSLVKKRKFTGGLSRLLKVGLVDRIVKLDYNSLYPSIMLTWNIESEVDIMHVINAFLNYVLTQREYYKGLKADAGSKVDELKEILNADGCDKDSIKSEIAHWKAIKTANDKKQLPLKILGNSIFGAFGNPSLFPWGDCDAAERVTCIGRQSLRLMISHFTKLGYTPVVGDSVTGDTPLFVKYENNLIDIKPISEMIESDYIELDGLGREYDYSKKEYQVLCRSGWMYPSYVYRHGTDKTIYTVSDEKSTVDVTEDHSLYNSKQEKIKPCKITSETELEYINNDCIYAEFNNLVINSRLVQEIGQNVNHLSKLPVHILNGTVKVKQAFINAIPNINITNKNVLAGIDFVKKCINYSES